MPFLKPQAQSFSNFASLFSVMKDNSSVFFKLKPHILLAKIALQSDVFGLLSGWVKIHQIPHVIHIWNHKPFFLLTLHHSSMPWEISILYFFSWNFIWFLQNFRVLTAQVKFHQICTLISYFWWKYIYIKKFTLWLVPF